jgi:hypothetical protein
VGGIAGKPASLTTGLNGLPVSSARFLSSLARESAIVSMARIFMSLNARANNGAP